MKRILSIVILLFVTLLVNGAHYRRTTYSAASGGCVSDSVVMGYTSTGADTFNPRDAIYCGRWQANCTGPIDELRYIVTGQSGAEGVTLGLYADSGGSINASAVLRDTGEVYGTGTSDETVVATLDSAYTVTSGTYYWICVATGSDLYVKKDVGSENMCRDTDETYVGGTMPTGFTCDAYTYEGSMWGVAQ